jgi:hypothetical protein
VRVAAEQEDSASPLNLSSMPSPPRPVEHAAEDALRV